MHTLLHRSCQLIKYGMLVLALAWSTLAQGQPGKGNAAVPPENTEWKKSAPPAAWALEYTAYRGFLWRHTPKLSIQTGQVVWGQELGVRLQTQGRKPWQAWQRYPFWGLALVHFRLGDGAHGDAWGFLPHLNVPVLRTGRWLATFRIGTGLGYVTRPYDYFSNPGQNAIGSRLNDFTQFRLGVEYRLNAFWRIQAGGAFSHFSNGASELPNYGVNLPGGFTALTWSPSGIREENFLPAGGNKCGGRRWGGLVSGSLALIEYAVIDGPRYPVWGFSGAAYVQLNRVNRLLAGAEYEYNQAVYAFGLRTGEFQNKQTAQMGATRLAATLADEFLFGNLGVQVLAGVYTGRRINRLISHSWYSKLTVRYYFPPLFQSPLRCHIGLTLKAHKTTAEMFTTHMGLVF